jgi:hypothetical protein
VTVAALARQTELASGKTVIAIAGTRGRDIFQVTTRAGGRIIRIDVLDGVPRRRRATHTIVARNVSQINLFGTRGDRVEVDRTVTAKVSLLPST